MTARHIALVVHDFSTGGSERIAIRLANRWVASGRRVTILCGTEQGALRVDSNHLHRRKIETSLRNKLKNN